MILNALPYLVIFSLPFFPHLTRQSTVTIYDSYFISEVYPSCILLTAVLPPWGAPIP